MELTDYGADITCKPLGSLLSTLRLPLQFRIAWPLSWQELLDTGLFDQLGPTVCHLVPKSEDISYCLEGPTGKIWLLLYVF